MLSGNVVREHGGTPGEAAAASEPKPAAAPPSAPPQPDKGTADEQRFNQTLDSASFPSAPAPPQDLGKRTIDQRQISRTLDSGEFPPSLAQEEPQGAAEKPRTDQTLDSGSFAAPPASPTAPAKDTGMRTIDQQRIGSTLDSDSFPSPPSAPPPLPAETPAPGAAEKPRLDQTLDSGSFPPQPVEERGKGTADERQAARTLDSDSFPPPRDAKKGTADERQVAYTYDSAASASDSGEPGEQGSGEQGVAQTFDSGSVPSVTKDRKKATADMRQIGKTMVSGGVPSVEQPGTDSTPSAATFDSDSFPGVGLVERVSMVWSGKVSSGATPRTSLKAAAQAVEDDANVVIQPRVLREAKAVGAGRADYEVLSRLGEGGMGVVLAARQASIDRTVALKMLKPAGAKDREARRKFLAEAVVTGDLEHPNIVPIYDLGMDETGALFYAMKRVKGTPWDSVLAKKTFQENLEILMKVADATAFAHSRGVVHRDLKPENVMLGDFGEVLLMDWGLAVPLGAASKNIGMAGTPAYMAPEMASGPVNRISIASDVYLLGAILYEVITGYPPHTGKDVMHCLFAAGRNEIRPTEKTGELVSIALKAMATEIENRYPNVQAFQDAIREYQSHSESILLSTRAEEDLREAQEHNEYDRFARALFGFQEARELWKGNVQAEQGITQASLAYARSALGKGDYDLAASLLSEELPDHAELLQEIKVAVREREARKKRLQAAKRIGAMLVAAVLLVITVSYFLIRAEAERAKAAEVAAEDARRRAVAQKDRADDEARKAQEQRAEAVKQANIAQKQTELANQKTVEAHRERSEAVKQKNLAEEQRSLAQTAQKKEEYEAYVARIGLAAAKIEENAFDRAIALLNECPHALRGWEWGRLMHLCTREVRSFDARQPVDAVAFAPGGKRFATGGWGGTARIWDAESGKELLAIPTGAQYVFAVAFSPDGKHLATGVNARPDYLKIWDATTGKLARSLTGHRDAVLSAVYSRDGKRLLTGSYDNTARLWDLETGQSREFLGHEWWVWNAAFSPDEKRIVTACQDGSVMVWSVDTAKPDSPFLGHVGPVYTAAFSPDGRFVASGGYDKRILLWEPDKIRPFDYETLTTKQKNPPPVYEALEAHTAGVRSLGFSANGRLLLSGGNDNSLRVWDVAGRKLLKTLRGHAGRVPACAFAPDGERLLSGSHDHSAKLWSISGYEEVRVFQGRVMEGHRDAIFGAAFSPDGQRIASASRDRTAKLWNTASAKEIRQFREGHEFLATTARFFPDGKRVLTAAVDNTARIWDVATGTQIFALQGTGPSAAVALSRDGRRILTGSDDRSAKLWDAESGSLLARLVGHRSEVTAVAISPDSRWLFTGDARGRLRLWDAGTGQSAWQAQGHSRGITAASFLPSGERVLTASVDNTVAQWDVQTGRERKDAILKHPDAVTSMVVSTDGRRALTACADRKARLWNLETGDQMGALHAGDEGINSAALSPDGRWAVTTSAAGAVRLWDLQTLREIAGDGGRGPFLNFQSGSAQVWSTIFSPDSAQLLTVGGNDARLWDRKTRRETIRFSPHGSVASVHFSPDGRKIVTASWDNTARIWNADTGLAELKLEGGHSQYVNDALFSPDGSKVLTASDDKTACLWDAKTAKVLRTFEGHEQRVRSAVFSPDGRRALTASHDKTARIWDADSGKVIHVLSGHRQAVLAAAFSADGTRVITASEDNRAKLWDAATGKELSFSLEGHTASVTSVAFSPDGRRAVTGSQDSTAKIWDAQTGKEILTLKGHAQEVTAVTFSPDGQYVLTGSRDGTLVLWPAVQWHVK